MTETVATEDISCLKVADLRNLLAGKGLSTTGKKGELIERLQAAASAHAATTTAASSTSCSRDIAGLELLASAAPASTAGTASAHLTSPGTKTATAAAPESVPRTIPLGTPVITPNMTETEKIAARKAKFGIKTDDDKLMDRAKRFGTTGSAIAEAEKMRQRAERFGLGATTASNRPSSNAVAFNRDEEEKRKKRAERFGIVDEEERKRKRAERFGVVSDEKMNKRLQRFAGSAPA